MAWIGIRPLATNSPPECRTAAPNGAAQTFSQINTAATRPGLHRGPDGLDVLRREQHRELRLQLEQLSEIAVAEVVGLKALHRPVEVLLENQQVEHANHAQAFTPPERVSPRGGPAASAAAALVHAPTSVDQRAEKCLQTNRAFGFVSEGVCRPAAGDKARSGLRSEWAA